MYSYYINNANGVTKMTYNFLKSAYGLTVLEANVFILFNAGHEVDVQFDNVLVRALRKISK